MKKVLIIVIILLSNYSYGNYNRKNAINLDRYNSISAIKIPNNNTTIASIKRYMNYSWLEKSLSVLNFYEPMIENKLSSYGLPLELKNLILVESAVNPRAISHVGAKGLWQFMPGTAKEYNLLWNNQIDLRYDPVASTDAACRLLKNLFIRYRSWALALSAYNCGPGNVNKAIRKAGSKNYWNVRKYLPKETQNYVPSFYACSYINTMSNYHNFNNYSFPISYKDVQILKTNTPTLLSDLKVKSEYVKFLNPHILTNTVPKNTYIYILK